MEYSGLKTGRQIIFFLALGLFVFFVSASLSAKVVFKKDPRQAMSMHMLRIAKEAHEAGDYYEAKRIWMQVRAISPALEEPAWLNERKDYHQSMPQDSTWNRQKLILAIDEYGFTEELLATAEKWLKDHPEDRLIRMLLLGHAAIVGNNAELTRHRSLLQQPQADQSRLLFFGKVLLSLVLFALIIWQILKIRKEFFRRN